MTKLAYEKPVISKITAGVPNKFGLPVKQKIIPNIDGIPVEKIMEEYGSPVFVLSEKTVLETVLDISLQYSTLFKVK